MHVTFIILFAIIFITIIICVFMFKEYKKDYLKSLEQRQLSLSFLLGFSAFCTDLIYKLPSFRNSASYNKTKKLVSSVNVGGSPDKSTYLHHLRLVSYIVAIISILSFLGFAYTISLITADKNTVSNLTRPSNGDGSQSISLNTDSELYTGVIDITIEDKKYSFDEVMKIFSDIRSSFDNHVLADNISFLHIDSPLNLPSVWGNEEISVSWFIGTPDIIDYTGALIEENIVSSGVPVEIVATLTLDDISADICYTLMVFPPKVTDKDIVEGYLNKFVNSEINRTEDVVELPDNILGFNISFSQKEKVYPSMDIYSYCRSNLNTCNYS